MFIMSFYRIYVYFLFLFCFSVTPNAVNYPMTPGNNTSVVSPTPSEYTIMDFSVCEDEKKVVLIYMV